MERLISKLLSLKPFENLLFFFSDNLYMASADSTGRIWYASRDGAKMEASFSGEDCEKWISTMLTGYTRIPEPAAELYKWLTRSCMVNPKCVLYNRTFEAPMLASGWQHTSAANSMKMAAVVCHLTYIMWWLKEIPKNPEFLDEDRFESLCKLSETPED